MTKLSMHHYSDPKPEHWPWPNFSPEELASNGNGAVEMEIQALNKLQSLRDEWGEPLHLNSAYRDPDYNFRIGGAKHSQHPQGTAFDINMRGWPLSKCKRFAEMAYKHRFTGFGGYVTGSGDPKFIHIDARGSKARWGRKWAWPKAYKK